MVVGWAALIVSVGQLMVGVLALRTPKSGTPVQNATRGLAANRQSLNAMLLAAVFLLVAATALLRLEASNSAEAAFFDGSGEGSEVGREDILADTTALVLTVLGGGAAVLTIWLAQRAWRGWSGAVAEPLGVALSALLAMAAGVVGVFLIAAMPSGSGPF